MPRRNNHPRHHGFTFVELLVGIIVTSIVLCALSVFTFGVSQSWTQGDSAQSVFLAGTQAVERINHIVRTAQMIEPSPTQGSLNNSTLPATCMFWMDSNGDGKIQYNEITVLQYLQSSGTIVQYNTVNTTYAAALPTDSSFLSLPNLTTTTLANDIAACQFFSVNATSTTQLPSLEVVLQISSSNPSIPSQLVYNTVTLRGPNGSPQ